MHVLGRTLLLLGVCLVASSPARAEVAVASGGKVTLMTLSEVDQGCHAHGQVSIGLIQSPQAGTVEVRPTLAYPNFPASNTRSRCNPKKVASTIVTYQSTPGYTGPDNVVLEAVYPSGGVRRYRIVISVR